MHSLVEDSTPLVVARDLFRSYPCPYWIAGGWAIDLFTQRVRRRHSDVDIAVLHRDIEFLGATFRNPRPLVYQPPTGKLREWAPDERLQPGPPGLLIPGDSHPCPIQVSLSGSDGDQWVYHRAAGTVRRPLARMTLTTERGLPFVAPEVALLYKSPMLRLKDMEDFADVHELLDAERRQWLIDNIAPRFPDHPWLPALRREQTRRSRYPVADPPRYRPQPAGSKRLDCLPTSSTQTLGVPGLSCPLGNNVAVQDDMRQRVGRILERFGISMAQATAAPDAQSDDVWLTEHIAVRLARHNNSRLWREIALAPLIPAAVGFPRVLDHGVIDEYQWLASTRLPGDNIHRIWPDLAPSARATAVSDLWSRLQVLHTTDIEAARSAGCISTPHYELDPDKALRQVTELIECGALTSGFNPTTGDRLSEVLSEAFGAIPLAPLALVHTDASPKHAVLTPTGQAIPLDLTSACIAPFDLELENLFRALYYLGDRRTFMHLANLASDVLAQPSAAVRLRGYAILRDLQALRLWLRTAPRGANPARSAPFQRLDSHAVGNSWLHNVS